MRRCVRCDKCYSRSDRYCNCKNLLESLHFAMFTSPEQRIATVIG